MILRYHAQLENAAGPPHSGRLAADRRSHVGLAILIAFLAAQVLDGTFTYVGVRRFGSPIEANPILSWLMGAFGEGPALAGAKLMASSFGIALHLTAVHRIVAALTLFYLAVAILPWAHILFW
jgi:hypothetical protein